MSKCYSSMKINNKTFKTFISAGFMKLAISDFIKNLFLILWLWAKSVWFKCQR